MEKVLNGITVVELGSFVAAPALGSFLGILGARVLKVEPPEGDPTRESTPWSWLSYSWNKESVVLDLKTEEGATAMKRLLKGVDIFIESLSPRAVRELSLEFNDVRKVNDRIIYCSVKGFASDSSSSNRVGFDTIAQAEGGLMYVAGEKGKPARVGNPCVDLAAATFGAIGVLASLMARPRRASYIEIPLYDVVVYWNGYWLPYIDLRGGEPTHLSTTHPAFSPYGVFTTRDGFVFIGVLTDSQWRKLVSKLGLKNLIEFGEAKTRILAREEINLLVQKVVATMTSTNLLSLLGDEVPCAKVNSLMDIYGDKELESRGVLRTVVHAGKKVKIALPPFLHYQVQEGDLEDPPLGSSTRGALIPRGRPANPSRLSKPPTKPRTIDEES